MKPIRVALFDKPVAFGNLSAKAAPILLRRIIRSGNLSSYGRAAKPEWRAVKVNSAKKSATYRGCAEVPPKEEVLEDMPILV